MASTTRNTIPTPVKSNPSSPTRTTMTSLSQNQTKTQNQIQTVTVSEIPSLNLLSEQQFRTKYSALISEADENFKTVCTYLDMYLSQADRNESELGSSELLLDNINSLNQDNDTEDHLGDLLEKISRNPYQNNNNVKKNEDLGTTGPGNNNQLLYFTALEEAEPSCVRIREIFQELEELMVLISQSIPMSIESQANQTMTKSSQDNTNQNQNFNQIQQQPQSPQYSLSTLHLLDHSEQILQTLEEIFHTLINDVFMRGDLYGLGEAQLKSLKMMWETGVGRVERDIRSSDKKKTVTPSTGTNKSKGSLVAGGNDTKGSSKTDKFDDKRLARAGVVR